MSTECDVEDHWRERRAMPEPLRHFLARRGMNRDWMHWEGDTERVEVVYPVVSRWAEREDATEEDFHRYRKMIPLVVPGARVTRTGWRREKFARRGDKGKATVWFTWSPEAMWERYQEVFEEYGVADERLAYMTCSGRTKSPQPSLPGLSVKAEAQASGNSMFSASYTCYGLHRIESGFCHRIQYPDRGGPEAVHYDRRVVYGEEWWLCGTRGDSEEVLEIEIKASPLHERVKQNLLDNLHNYRKQHPLSTRRCS